MYKMFYKASAFEILVDLLLVEYKEKTLQERKAKVEEMIEDYYLKNDKFPDSYQLHRLGDLILHDDLSNPSSYKVQQEEYPFHSFTQQKRRKKKEFVAEGDVLEHMNYKSKKRQPTSPPKDLQR
ncbi:hypothetical protein [Jeotgalibacillus marinus]|uniref:Uncharacterized protein n=1 Tax=Jeotgalibacillus marinus TaxID=86667 RepID=A0ABV3Q624_9BACL